MRTAQFDTILNEPPVILIQMRVNTCFLESVPHIIPHLETRITDTSFIQNNIKSGSPGMCSNIRPGFSICTYRLQSNTSPKNHKEQFYITRVRNLILQIRYRRVQLTSNTSLGLTKAILYRNLKIIIFTCSHGVRLR